ncbi:cellulase family glycosylhydrolase [Chryseolinea lacunae]|uniref:Cellulase family glycosylhydrolase n=1 Tax=Chryseolinea lacunae TaxID=2801331 RepID=A0ABS1KJD4_9BACT|nr:cellulase family glycosylhydrolase [Chryseolinea lacunae]MBL0739576.1 cellulase family glycosylhydrolase [Chryseolinea lacunae]
MKISCRFQFLVFFITIVFFISCKKDDVTPELTVTPLELALDAEGDTSEFSIATNDRWTITNAADTWLELSQTSGNSGSTTIKITVNRNSTGSLRSSVLTINSNNGQARRLSISQKPTIYPSYNTSPKAPDATGMGSNAVELAAKMKLGWNIGNTMEASGGETGWGNPQITEDYVKFVKANGFNAIRIPCAWDWHHLDDTKTARINQAWLNRVKEVIGYCVNNDVYVLLNIHWDGGWLENNISKVKQDSVNAKQKALWEQIATTMRDFDEHLMFASANEPAADNAEKTEVLASYHQTFINAVRSTGGRNSYRVLVLQGPSTSMTLTPQLMSKLPQDPVANRLMVEVHNYSPSQFCFLAEDVSWGKMAYYWGKDYQSSIEPDRNFLEAWDWGNEAAQLNQFKLVKEAFVDKGIPVLIGEYGAYRRDGQKNEPKDLVTHNNAVDYWITLVTKQARTNGMVPFWWDTGAALDRSNLTVKDQRTIDAIMAGAQ